MADVGFKPQSVWWHVVSLDPDAPFICFSPSQHILFLLLSLSHSHMYTLGMRVQFTLSEHMVAWRGLSWETTGNITTIGINTASGIELKMHSFSAANMQRKVWWGLNLFCSTRKKRFSSYQTCRFPTLKGEHIWYKRKHSQSLFHIKCRRMIGQSLLFWWKSEAWYQSAI